MNDLIILLTLTSGYYMVILSILEKEDKEKIFYIIFMTIVFILVEIVLTIIKLSFLNPIIFWIFFFLAHSFYTNFALINKINEYFLKNTKPTEMTLRSIIIKLINKEMTLLNQEVYALTQRKKYVKAFLFLTFWTLLSIVMLLHTVWYIDLLSFLKNIF